MKTMWPTLVLALALTVVGGACDFGYEAHEVDQLEQQADEGESASRSLVSGSQAVMLRPPTNSVGTSDPVTDPVLLDKTVVHHGDPAPWVPPGPGESPEETMRRGEEE